MGCILSFMFKMFTLILGVFCRFLWKTGAWMYAVFFPPLAVANIYISAGYMKLRYGYGSMDEILSHVSGMGYSPLGWMEGVLEAEDGAAWVDWAVFWAFVMISVPVLLLLVRMLIRFAKSDPGWTYRNAIKKHREKKSAARVIAGSGGQGAAKRMIDLRPSPDQSTVIDATGERIEGRTSEERLTEAYRMFLEGLKSQKQAARIDADEKEE